MKDIINKGQVMSILIYLLYGVSIIIGMTFDADGFGNYAIAAIFFWCITGITMIVMRMSALRHSMAYKSLYILSICFFAVAVQLCFQSIYVVFIMFAILWLTVITFLDKKMFHFTIITQTGCMLFLLLIPRRISGLVDYNFMSLIFSCLGFWAADWVSCNIINILLQLDEETQEHDRSLDDLLDIVEAKHKEATKATQAKSEFLSTMSHELRTPLNAIIGLNEMVLRETEDIGVVEYSKDIKAAGNMMLSLVNDILDLSKIESNKMTIIPVDFSMRNMIKDIINMITPRMKAKGLTFSFKIEPQLMACYHGDDVRLKQILVNLLNNAAKYTKEGSVELRVTGERNESESKLHFSVKDTGIGIKSEDLEKLNKKFVRLDEAKNRNIEGTGLGITIVNAFLNLMNSELKVTSEYGVGSDFYFDIVLPNVDNIKDDNKRKDTSEDEVFVAEDMNILVVDDTPVNLTVFVSLLKRNKVKVDTAGGGYEAIEKASVKKYDVIFLDRMMPELDGIATLEKMRSLENFINEKTPIVALTADAVAGSRQYYVNAGFDDYLSKPIVPGELENMIKHYWRNSNG